jgi:hypothetical protein
MLIIKFNNFHHLGGETARPTSCCLISNSSQQ